MPASNEIQVAGGEPGPTNLDEIETGVDASSATEDDSSALDADGEETNGESSAVVAGTTSCLLATLFSI